MLAYNQFSSRTGYNGRRGAAKMLIFETDGVPNTRTTGTFNNGGGDNSPFSALTGGGFVGHGDPTGLSNAKAVVQQICNLDSASQPGYSTAKLPVRVHSIAFGNLFEQSNSTETMALQFLLDVQKIGATSAAGDTSIENYKIIIGDYNTRID